MTMLFRDVKTSLIDKILGPAEAGKFRTVGYQRQSKSALESINNDRSVQVYYIRGEFSKAGGRQTGPTQHDMSFKIDFTVSSPAKGDLSVINDSGSTASQVATAIQKFQVASAIADESLDELFDIVYQILMDARNADMGLSEGLIANRWIGELQKDDPVSRGELVTLTGSATLTMRGAEQVLGATGSEGAIIETTVPINEDPNDENTGVISDI